MSTGVLRQIYDAQVRSLGVDADSMQWFVL